MARQRMVTRTIVTREVIFKKFNMETGAIQSDKLVFGIDVSFTGRDIDKITRINNRLSAMGQKATCVMIDSIEDKETLYGMSEDDFIRYAQVLPPRATIEE